MDKIIIDIKKIMKENRITPKELAFNMGLKSHSLHWIFYTRQKASKKKIAELIDTLLQIAKNRRKEAVNIEKKAKAILLQQIEIGSRLKSSAGDGSEDTPPE